MPWGLTWVRSAFWGGQGRGGRTPAGGRSSPCNGQRLWLPGTSRWTGCPRPARPDAVGRDKVLASAWVTCCLPCCCRWRFSSHPLLHVDGSAMCCLRVCAVLRARRAEHRGGRSAVTGCAGPGPERPALPQGWQLSPRGHQQGAGTIACHALRLTSCTLYPPPDGALRGRESAQRRILQDPGQMVREHGPILGIPPQAGNRGDTLNLEACGLEPCHQEVVQQHISRVVYRGWCCGMEESASLCLQCQHPHGVCVPAAPFPGQLSTKGKQQVMARVPGLFTHVGDSDGVPDLAQS